MKFYFCEKCGKRVTDADLADGRARDKQVKGVHCQDCASSVLTMEFKPLTVGEADAILAREQDAQRATAPSRGSGAVQRPAGTQDHKRGTSAIRIPPAKARPAGPAQSSGSPLWLFTLAIAASLLCVGLALVLGSKPGAPARHAEARPAAASPAPAPPQRPAEPPAPGPRAPEPAPEAERPPAAPQPETPPVPAPAPVAAPAPATPQPPAVQPSAPEPQPAAPAVPAAPPAEPAADKQLGDWFALWRAKGLKDAAARDALAGLQAAWSADLRAALDGLARRDLDLVAAFRKRVGETVRLETKARGVQNGKLEAVEGQVLVVAREFIINGRVQGSTTVRIALDELAPAAVQAFYPEPEPAHAAAWLSRALAQAAEQNLDAAASSLAQANGLPVQTPLAVVLEQERALQAGQRASAAWNALAARLAQPLAQAQARELEKEFEAWEKTHAASAFAKNPAQQARCAEARDELRRVIAGLDPRIAQAFKGRLEQFDPRKRELALNYDLKLEEQLLDWGCVLGAPPGPGSALRFDKNGFCTVSGSATSVWLTMPFVDAANFKLRMDYKHGHKPAETNKRVLLYFYAGTLPQDAAKYVLSAGPGGFYLTSHHEAVNVIDITKVKAFQKSATPLDDEGVLEAEWAGRKFSLKVNGRAIMDYETDKPPVHPGLMIGGGWGAIYSIRKLHLAARYNQAAFDQYLNRAKPAAPEK